METTTNAKVVSISIRPQGPDMRDVPFVCFGEYNQREYTNTTIGAYRAVYREKPIGQTGVR